MTRLPVSQRGVSIVEVMIALSVLMFAALSISNLQSRSMISMEISESHFRINERAADMLELLRANSTRALGGDYNLGYEEIPSAADPVTAPVDHAIGQWKERLAQDLRDGEGMIDCDPQKCTVSVRWTENIDGTNETQYFRMAGPL